jgi:phage shock protein C
MARLIRSNNKIIAGVCDGLAENFHIDVKLMRLIFVILLFVTFSAMGVAYIILWVLMPVDARSRNYKERMQDRLGL